jgi:hypothetical protein
VTQYPSPYNPPPNYPQYAGYYPQQDLLAPARRASWLMIAIAVLMCFCGICMAGFSRINFADLPVESRMQFENLERQFQALGMSMKTMFMIYGIVTLVPGIAMLVLALFVRRGGMVSLILSLVLASLLALMLGLSVISSFFTGGGQALLGACFCVVPISALVLLIVWLIQALRARPQMSAMQSQYAAYYQQYQQAQQAYQQAYGYAAVPGQQQPQPPAQSQNQPPTQGPSDAPPQG